MITDIGMKKCNVCHLPIADVRLKAVPNTSICTSCLERSGDVKRTIGYMSWEHKTAPTLITSAEVGEEAIKWLHKNSRRCNRASLPLVSKSRAESTSPILLSQGAEFDSLRETKSGGSDSPVAVTDIVPSCGHRDKPVVADGRFCVDCWVAKQVNWYARRIVR